MCSSLSRSCQHPDFSTDVHLNLALAQLTFTIQHSARSFAFLSTSTPATCISPDRTNERTNTYCLLVCSFPSPLTVEKLANGPLTVSTERDDSAPVEPWRFPSAVLLRRVMLLAARVAASAHRGSADCTGGSPRTRNAGGVGRMSRSLVAVTFVSREGGRRGGEVVLHRQPTDRLLAMRRGGERSWEEEE